MAAIANRNGRNMVQHVLLPVNIYFHWNLFIFEISTIFFIFILPAILKWRPFWKFWKQRAQLWVTIYVCVKFQKDPLFDMNLTFFAPWLPWKRHHFEFHQPLKSSHILRWIFLQSFMKFEERNPTKI
jgi:hypothetical protein